ncbi:hypothetical protein I4J43_12280 [Corynebacterium belfantii]|nr:hypothetical protein [Corynebacterium belfantii]
MVVFVVSSRWDPSPDAVEQLCYLVSGGHSVRSAALELGLSLSIAYRLAREYQLPVACSEVDFCFGDKKALKRYESRV